jgi:soluble cytochrome b562
MSERVRVLSIAAGILFAAGALAFVANARPVARADEDSVLDQSMGQLNRGWRALRGPASTGDFAKVLETLPAMQAGAVQAKGEIPPRIAGEKDAAKRAEQQKRYRLQMIALIEELLAMEKAALAADKEKLAASVEKVRGIQKAGHDEFQEPEEKEHGG